MTYMGNGEGHTLLILTMAESLLIRSCLGASAALGSHRVIEAEAAYNRGIQRGADKIKAEFDAIQKAKCASQLSPKPAVQKDKP